MEHHAFRFAIRRGMDLEDVGNVNRLPVVFLILAACGGERDTAKTATIPPAEPRPAATLTTTPVSKPMITISGSPPPAEAIRASGSETVTVRNGRIDVRPLLPRGNTAFRIENATAASHHLVLRGGNRGVEAVVPAGGVRILQTNLTNPRYELVCTTAGHDERARFRTYAPGLPLQSTK